MKLERLNLPKNKNWILRMAGLRISFASNGRQDIYDVHLDEIFNDPKTPAVIMLDSCDIKPLNFLKYSPQN